MSETLPVVRLYYLPQQFPCGPQSSCCGPVGQSAEEVGRYVDGLTATLPGIHVETVDASKKLNVRDHGPVIKLLNTFGANACPILTVGTEVLSMGPPMIPELVHLLRGRLAAAAE